ncbi:hypothetical protein GZ22_18585 (plasmid) [Terribacillus saccharophilus]|uniref:Uncharacterized protein n=2 Tax=Terribacillus saccharophilus TaxID=361277 RepID=A0A075LQM7_9BACI|nr:hypothetical protein GZ22_18585 [Terribacillus goriensis]
MAVLSLVGATLLLFGKEIVSLFGHMNSLQRIGVLCIVVVLIIFIGSFMYYAKKEFKYKEAAWYIKTIYNVLFILMISILVLDFVIIATGVDITQMDTSHGWVSGFIIINGGFGAGIAALIIFILNFIIGRISKPLKPNEKLTLIVAVLSAVIALLAVLKS